MYLNQILFKSSEKNSNKTMIIFDRASSHFSERINELFEKFNSKYSLILPGQTSYVQHLDVSIHKSFKSAIHKKYTQFQIDNKNSKIQAKIILLSLFMIYGMKNLLLQKK